MQLLCWIYFSCMSSLVNVIGVLMYKLSCHLQIKTIWPLSLQHISLISSSWPIALARSSSTILIKYGQSEDICLVSDFRGNVLSFYPFDLMLPIGFLYIAFIVFHCDHHHPNLPRTLIMKVCWTVSKEFFCI